ncbi:MAG: hypothetical protein RJA22_1731 [Verrucomicrobiota bacterium]
MNRSSRVPRRGLADGLVWILLAVLLSPPAFAADGSPPAKVLPLPGEVFQVEGRPAFLIPAPAPAGVTVPSRPWVWYAPTLPGLPGPEERWMFEQFRRAGLAVAGLDVGESYGSPGGTRLYSALHAVLSGRRGYSTKPVLLGRSRGGLMTLSWAAENPDKVGGFAGIYPVCNLASYPGLARAAGAFGLTAEGLQAELARHNPIDRLAPLARAGVPLFAIHGDVDTLVPLEANSGIVRDRYAALGGRMELIVPKGQGHNMWTGFFQCAELVQFVRAHAGPNLTLESPTEFQVFQRSSKSRGTIVVRGELAGASARIVRVEGRVVADRQPGPWRQMKLDKATRRFASRWDAPAGGWHRIEVRAVSGPDTVAATVVEQVGVGEIFVVAGQSNSANHGGEKQETRTGRVVAFDGRGWRLARDPQPGASGGGGSFLPPFGDALAERLGVPIGLVACGVGATSVREWLPAGAQFPNPPTLTGHVRALTNGGWTSRGTLFTNFTTRLRALGPDGFRAVLWHQGESDANQADPTRTLPGRLYREYLTQLIRATARDIGWKAPWFVAQASYHTPADPGSDDLRAAQAALWRDKIALPGPDTDALQGEFRDGGGQGVHFSGPGLRAHAAAWVDKVAPWLEQKLP